MEFAGLRPADVNNWGRAPCEHIPMVCLRVVPPVRYHVRWPKPREGAGRTFSSRVGSSDTSDRLAVVRNLQIGTPCFASAIMWRL